MNVTTDELKSAQLEKSRIILERNEKLLDDFQNYKNEYSAIEEDLEYLRKAQVRKWWVQLITG